MWYGLLTARREESVAGVACPLPLRLGIGPIGDSDVQVGAAYAVMESTVDRAPRVVRRSGDANSCEQEVDDSSFADHDASG